MGFLIIKPIRRMTSVAGCMLSLFGTYSQALSIDSNIASAYEHLAREFPISEHTIIIGYAQDANEYQARGKTILGQNIHGFVDVANSQQQNNVDEAVAIVLDRSGNVIFRDTVISTAHTYLSGVTQTLVAGPITFISDARGLIAIGSVSVDVTSTSLTASEHALDATAAIVVGVQYPFSTKLYAKTVIGVTKAGKGSASVGTGRGKASVGTGRADASVGTGKGSASVGTGRGNASVGTGRADASVGTGKGSASVGTD